MHGDRFPRASPLSGTPLEADCLGEPQQPGFLADESAIKLVALFDELLDARTVQGHPLEQFDAL